MLTSEIGLMAIRWFLGMAESAFFPLVIYYQVSEALPSIPRAFRVDAFANSS